MALHFHLAGINNQNFLMRDEETGTYWQQITGRAIAGRLAGRQLSLVSADELTFALWKREQPDGTVLNDVPRYASDYAPENWDARMARVPTVISYAQAGLKPRDLMLGVDAFGDSRAFPFPAILKQGLIQDHVGSEPVLLVVGGDGQSVRVFRRRVPHSLSEPNFYRVVNRSTAGADPRKPDALFMDAETGSEWNFEGCATSGKLTGVWLERVNALKDYWFDWRNYHPATTVYGINVRIRSDGQVERKNSLHMTEQDVISNQKTILSNQQQIISHQKLILENQETIKKNQATLDTIVANQEKILALLSK